jgi:hypothetical protein
MGMGIVLTVLFAFSAYAETVDLQWAICESQPQAIAEDMKLEPQKTKHLSYYEEQGFTLRARGVYLKTSKKKNKLESEVKIQSESDYPGASCELDRYGNKITRKCSLEESSKELWSGEQMRMAESRAGSIAWNRLTEYGPFEELRWKGTIADYEASMEALYPDGQAPISEISVKIKEAQAEQAYREVNAFLLRKKITLCSQQEGKADRLFRIRKN